MKSSSSHLPAMLPTSMPPSSEQVGKGAFLVLQSTPERERHIALALAGNAAELIHPESVEDVERLVSLAAPDVLVLDRAMKDWPALCRVLKNGTRHQVPIVVIDWEDGGELAAVAALDAGADEFVGKPTHGHELKARLYNQLRHKRRMDTTRRLRAERDSLRFDVSRDALTTVLTRKALDRSLRELEREDTAFSLIFLDVDHFKAINDGFGHAIGDRVLGALGRLLRDELRPNDVVGRYGGEEFVIVLRDAGPEAARRVGERVRQAISAATIAGLPGRVTVSAGLAVREGDEGAEALIARADLALYAAKRAGRNRVLVAPPRSALEEAPVSTPADSLVPPKTHERELELGHSAAE